MITVYVDSTLKHEWNMKFNRILCNESPNWGVEIGYAFAKHKKVIGLASSGHDIPLMARCMLSDTLKVDDLDAVGGYIDKLATMLHEA